MNSIPTQPLAMLRHYLRPHRGRVALLFLLLAGSITLQLLGPQGALWTRPPAVAARRV